MRKISLLDCTLRDGGYVNDWEFGHNNLISVFERLVDSGVDIVEVGFIDDRRPLDINRSIFPDTESIETIFRDVAKKPPMIVGMIDYGTCDISYIQDCKDSFLDGIRVIFKKGKMKPAMEYCRALKAKGYKVFSQLVSITAYNDNDLQEIIALVNDVKPYAVSMVDTYGLLDPEMLLSYYEKLDKGIDKDIQIGYHAHNNFQLAYANGRAFLARETDRDILVDGTLFGMGKSAGNAPLELLAMHLNAEYGKSYNTNPMLEAIEESIKKYWNTTPWGYKTFFYLSAANKCHPSYVEYFQSKGNLSSSKLNELLSRIEPEEKKLLYDKNIAEQVYQEYVQEFIDDDYTISRFKKEFAGKNILLVGPGKNIKLQLNKVEKYISEKNPVVISINYLPDFIKTDYVFVTKMDRYEDMTTILKERDAKIIATSNLECRCGDFEYMFGREPLLESKEEIKDNPLLMFLKILLHSDIHQVACAGFDGYSDKEDNYLLPGMEYDFVKTAASHLNRHIRDVLFNDLKDIEINFITFSHYNVISDVDSAAF